MPPNANAPQGLSSLPLWRLLVELDDVERAVGADSPTARLLARLIQERLRQGRAAPAASSQEARRG
jgi:hypothetical protein